MATIARLIIAMGTDPTGLKRGLNQGVNEIRQFARSASQIGQRSNISGNLDTPAKRAAESAVQALRRTLAIKMADIRENVNLKIFTPERAQAEAQAAAIAFNTGLRRELANLSSGPGFTSRIHAGLVAQFLDIGDASGQAFARGFSRATQLVRSLGLATRRIGTELTAAVTVPILAAGAASIHFARDFNKAMANVATLIPGQRELVESFKDSVLALARETGVRGTELAQGLYQVVSAFGAAADTSEKLAINARAAMGGLSTVTDAVNLTSSVTKGFGDTSAAAVQKVADLALLAVRLGQTTFPELAQSIGRASPLAAMLNISMEELLATLATGAKVTGDVSEVSTQLRGILQALQSPTETMKSLFAAMGVETGAAAIKQFGFINVIKAVIQSANASGRSLQEYIAQIEGQTLAINLAGAQADSYSSKLQQMQNAVGTTTAAFDEQVDGINASGHALDVVARQFEEIAIRLGTALGPNLLKALPALESIGNTIIGLVNSFGSLSAPTQEFVLTLALAAVAFGPIIHVAGTLITTLAAVARTLFIAQGAGVTFAGVMALIASPVVATVLAVGGLIALVVLFRKEITAIDDRINQWIAGSLAGMARQIPIIGNAVANFLEFLAGPKAVAAARSSGAKIGKEFVDQVQAQLATVKPSGPALHADLPTRFLRDTAQKLGPVKPIVLVDPKELNAQVQTAVDRLNLAREAGKSIAAPFRDLVRLQDLLNTRLAQGKLTIDDENQLTRALLNTRVAIGNAAGTSVEAISNRVKIAIDTLELAAERGDDLAAPMRAVSDILDIVNNRLDKGVNSLGDQNTLTRDLLAGQKALAEANKPDTRAFDAFAATARGALAQLQALKAASQVDVQVPTSDAAEQLERLVQTQFLLNGAGQEYNRQLVEIRTAYANILGVIQSTVNPTREQLDLAKQLGAALQEAARVQVLRGAPVAVQNLLSQLNLAANSYADSIAAFQIAREAIDKSAARSARKESEGFQRQAIVLQKQIAELVRSGAIDPTTGLAVLERMRKLMQSMGIDMSNINTQTSKWLEQLGKAAGSVVSVLQGVEGLLDAMGALDEGTRKVIEGFTKVAQNLPKAATGDPSAILGVIGGLVQGISGIFGGQSPEEKERLRTDRENHNVLLRIARGVEQINISSSGSQFAQLRDIFAQINDPTRFLLKDNTKLGNRVSTLLAANGLDIEDVKRTAQELGLTFQNTAQFYRDFNRALQEVDLTSFQNNFTGQLDLLQRSFQIFNITDPAEKLRRTIELLSRAGIGSPAIAKALEGVDLSTADGIRDFQKRIQTLFDNFDLLTPEDLGGLSAQQFLDALATAAGLSQEALDALTNSVAEATHEMLNVPTGFRQARAEFLAQSQAVRVPGAIAIDSTAFTTGLNNSIQDLVKNTASGIDGSGITDRLDQIRDILAGTGAGARPETKGKQDQITYLFQIAEGAIHVASDGRKPAQQAEDLVRLLRLKAHATTGDSTRIGDV